MKKIMIILMMVLLSSVALALAPYPDSNPLNATHGWHLDESLGTNASDFIGEWHMIQDVSDNAFWISSFVDPSFSNAGNFSITYLDTVTGTQQENATHWSFSLWARLQNNNQVLLARYRTGAESERQWSFQYGTATAGELRINICDDGGGSVCDAEETTGFSGSSGQIWHIAVTYENGFLMFYKNGTNFYNGSVTTEIDTALTPIMEIGAETGTAGFQGLEDDVLFFDGKVLTPNEVNSIANGSIGADTIFPTGSFTNPTVTILTQNKDFTFTGNLNDNVQLDSYTFDLYYFDLMNGVASEDFGLVSSSTADINGTSYPFSNPVDLSSFGYGAFFGEVTFNDTSGNEKIITSEPFFYYPQMNISFADPTPADFSTINSTRLYINVSSSMIPEYQYYSLCDINGDFLLHLKMADDIEPWFDDSIYGITGTAEGNAAVDPEYYMSDYSPFLQLDGVGDYLNYSSTDSLNPFHQFTIAGWIHVNTSGSTKYIMEKGSMYRVTYDATKQVSCGFYRSGWQEVTSASIYTVGNWNFFSCTYDLDEPENIIVYLNGEVDNNVTGVSGTGNLSITNSPLTIGCNNNAANCIDGYIDEIVMFNRTLDADEIRSLYNASAYPYEYNHSLKQGTYEYTCGMIPSYPYAFNITTRTVTLVQLNIAPTLGNISHPLNDTNLTFLDSNNTDQVAWYGFFDEDGHTLNYTVYLMNADNSTVNKTFGSTLSETISADYTGIINGTYAVNVKACDPYDCVNVTNAPIYVYRIETPPQIDTGSEALQVNTCPYDPSDITSDQFPAVILFAFLGVLVIAMYFLLKMLVKIPFLNFIWLFSWHFYGVALFGCTHAVGFIFIASALVIQIYEIYDGMN